MVPVSDRIDRSVSAVPRRLAIWATALQCYLVASYLLAGVLPYFWRQPPRWLSEWGGAVLGMAFGLLFGMVGFWVTVIGAGLVFVALAGGVAWAAVRHRVSPVVGRWLAAASVLCLVYAGWALTPAANVIRTWILD